MAIQKYHKVQEIVPDEPLPFFCMGLCLLHLAFSRKIEDRNSYILQAFGAFFQYAKLNPRIQESNFNLGRGGKQRF